MIIYNEFMNKRGVNTISHLSSPRLFKQDELVLPQLSTVHFVSYDIFEVGVERQHPLLVNYEGKVYSHDIRNLVSPKGRFTARVNKLDSSLRQYYRQNVTIRMARNIERVSEDYRVLIVDNYAPISQTVKFVPSLTREYDIWWSYQNTVLSQVKSSNRNHFLLLDIPTLPDVATFKLHLIKGLSTSELSKYKNKAYYTLLALTRAICNITGEGAKGNNTFTVYQDHAIDTTKVDDDSPSTVLHNLNFVINEGGQWCTFNFDRLYALASKTTSFDTVMYKLFSRFEDLRNASVSVPTLNDGTGLVVDDVEVEDSDTAFVLNQTTLIKKDHSVNLNEQLGLLNVIKNIEKLSASGKLTTASKKRLSVITEKHKKLTMPGTDTPLIEVADLSKVDLSLNNVEVRPMDSVPDKSMLKPTVKNMDKAYIEKALEPQLIATVLGIQNMSIMVTDFKKDEHSDVNDAYVNYRFQLTPLGGGEPSTSIVKIPKVQSDGTWKASGTTYRTAKVRKEYPIVKVSNNRVSITTNTAKTFVDRSEKVVDSVSSFLSRNINLIIEDPANNTISKVVYGECVSRDVKVPRFYSAIAHHYRSLTIKGVKYEFDASLLTEHFGESSKEHLKNGDVPVAKKGDTLYLMTTSGMIITYNNGIVKTIGLFPELLGLNMEKCPREYATIKLNAKNVPVILVLGYLYGLTNVLKWLGVNFKVIEGRINTELPPGQMLRFRNNHLWIADEGNNHLMITNGLKVLKRMGRDLELMDMDKEPIYQVIMEGLGLKQRYLDTAFVYSRMLIDPVTREWLSKNNLPTDFKNVLAHCCSLLTYDSHQKPRGVDVMRYAGYDRFNAAIGQELMKAAIQYHRSNKGARTRVQLHPKGVWSTIVMDTASAPIESNNPMHNMKEKGAVTFSGFDGRSSRMLNWDMRRLDPEEMGIIGADSPDSGKVGTSNHLTPSANIKSSMGEGFLYDGDFDDSATVMTGVGALLPCVDQDTMKRILFGSIQASARDAAAGYEICPVSTGFDVAMAHHVDKLWAWPASQDGVVSKVTDSVMEVTYKDGTKETNQIGALHGYKAGKVKPRKSVAYFKQGDKFKKDDILTYNSDFFEPYFMEEKQVCFKMGKLTTVAFMENNDTLEDGSALSESYQTSMSTPITKVVEDFVPFDKAISSVIKVGDEVASGDLLCVISEDFGDVEEDELLSAINNLNKVGPKSSEDGVISRIEVKWYGDKEKMSPSVKRFINKMDKEQAQLAEELNDGTPSSCQVKEPIRMKGKALPKDSLFVKFYIEKSIPQVVGGKGALGNQLKSVHGRILHGKNQTEDGREIHMLFGGESMQNRNVGSPMSLGTTIVILQLASKHVFNLYKEG